MYRSFLPVSFLALIHPRLIKFFKIELVKPKEMLSLRASDLWVVDGFFSISNKVFSSFLGMRDSFQSSSLPVNVQDVNLNTLYCKRIGMSNEISYEM